MCHCCLELYCIVKEKLLHCLFVSWRVWLCILRLAYSVPSAPPGKMVSMRFGAVEQRCIAESNKYMAIDRPWHHRSLVCLCPLASSNRCGVDMCERLPCIGMVRSLRWSKGRYICKYITYTCTCTHTFFKGSYTLWSDVWKVFCAWALICNYMWYMYISVAMYLIHTSCHCPPEHPPV